MEDRQTPRLDGVSEVEIRCAGRPTMRVSLKDISSGGLCVCFVRDAAAFAIGSEIGFSFRVPTGTVAGTGVVVWTDGAERTVGLQLRSFDDPASRSVLGEFLGSPLSGVLD